MGQSGAQYQSLTSLEASTISVVALSARFGSFAHQEETDVNDMIGFAGMLRGWKMLWHMELVWLLPALLVSVTVAALMEMLISNWRLRRSPVHPQAVGVREVPVGSQLSPAAITPN
jgi:hypothetical protein